MRINRAITSLKSYSEQVLKIFAFTFVCLYFSYQLMNGQNGIVSYFKQKAKLEMLEKKLAIVEHKTKALEGKAHKLYQKSLDPDLLDEQYRRATGKIKSNEKIYYYED